MMDTTTSVVTTGVVVTLGRWSEEKPLEFKQFVGFGIYAIFIAVAQSANNKLAQQFATLVMVAGVMFYAIPIAKKLGLTYGSTNRIEQIR